MIIRKAELSDLKSIMTIEMASFIPEIREDESVFKQRILRCPDLFLVFEEKKVKEGQTFFNTAGYLSAEIMNHIPKKADELKLGHIPADIGNKIEKGDRPFVYISSFALLPEYRGEGNGKKIWNDSLEYFKERIQPEGFLLLVNELWAGARHIYEKSGFSTVNSFENFFPSEDGQFSNGILMQNLLE